MKLEQPESSVVFFSAEGYTEINIKTGYIEENLYGQKI